jgi:DNA topoisomerase I
MKHAIGEEMKSGDRKSLSYVAALLIRVINTCHFRLGNMKYKNLYKSYGVTNIEVRHTKVKDGKMSISFVGKKGVQNKCKIVNKDLVERIVELIGDKSAKEPVFTCCRADDGCAEAIRPEEINGWMKSFGMDLTSKMFRTYAANSMLIDLIRANFAGPKKKVGSMSAGELKRILLDALDEISETIHNTRAVCKKEYVSPQLVALWVDSPKKFIKMFPPDSEKNGDELFLEFLKK